MQVRHLYFLVTPNQQYFILFVANSCLKLQLQVRDQAPYETELHLQHTVFIRSFFFSTGTEIGTSDLRQQQPLAPIDTSTDSAGSTSEQGPGYPSCRDVRPPAPP